jgi:hypothetical protein
MRFRNLDSSGDWVFGSGTGAYATGSAAIGLNIKTRLLSWLNDCFFAQTAGIDYYNRLGDRGTLNQLSLDMQRIISQSFGVTAITSFSVEQIGRKFIASYEVQTIFSESFQAQTSVGIP